jgi:hypothetical protein
VFWIRIGFNADPDPAYFFMKLIQDTGIQNPDENLDLPMDFKKILMKRIRKPIVEDFFVKCF